jgi:hypothetical protein
MSPPSRRAEFPSGSGRSGSAGKLAHGTSSRPPVALFAEMLRAARELLAVRSPLDAELMVSELVGTWWRQQPRQHGGNGRHLDLRSGARADVEELIGEGLVGYAAEQGSPAALALLSGIACLGTAHQALKAERAALDLIERGVPRPGWAEHAGAVVAAECYVNTDVYGDRDEVICVFSYAGQDEHALVVVVDYNAGGMIKDGWVTSQVAKLLAYCHDLGDPDGPRGTFGRVDPPDARRLLESALLVTETVPDPPVSKSFPSYHAFIRARIRTLPPTPPRPSRTTEGAGALAAGGPSRNPATAGVRKRSGSGRADRNGSADAGQGLIGPGASRRMAWRPDRRAMLVAEFLASDEAEDLSDRNAASRCADHIVDYGCDQDFGRPLRVSPAKAETFLLSWLPRKVMLTAPEQHAMPHVLVAWTRWAGARSGLEIAAISKTLDAVFEAMGTFITVYRDPASFGLEPDLVGRLLPDRDLEALPRRALAFGVLEGTFRGTDLGLLDPADANDRRILLEADHDYPGGRVSSKHIDRHAAVAERLWRGDPPELWEAAQRMLDLGMPRHDVVHALIDVLEAAGPGERAIKKALRDLPPEPTD